MDVAVLPVLLNPILIIFVLCTIVAYLGNFFRSWIVSCVLVLLFTLIFFVVVITIGQIAGMEDQIRYYVTAHYSFFSTFSLSLRDIILIIVIAIAFQFAIAFHVTKIDLEFQKHLLWLPHRRIRHYEMENTLDTFAEKYNEESGDLPEANANCAKKI
jgi:hypothetical protein